MKEDIMLILKQIDKLRAQLNTLLILFLILIVLILTLINII